ncbi:PREDICTED: DNA polymerase zeta catalytic subunit-like [Wasmannia auropunctata]|uniref:DNA polymerase zeta catalytic subunit-like n=1 Tax=Wasmannia auropunctata TaxID=64793 RepID=UPI0005ED47A8|nr:PREDICTED: DNA polymerase zeta catalytic subunit-like [Wasmannia auropunctata]
MEVVADPSLIPNSMYYITKVNIPPLNRCFNLFGIDANVWYKEISHRSNFDHIAHLAGDNPKSTIRQFEGSAACITCGEQTNKEICPDCLSQAGPFSCSSRR